VSHAWLRPRFETPGVAALMTTREGGVSGAPYASLNLGIAVGDAPADVERNRARFAQAIGGRPVFLKQVHGTTVLELAPHSPPGDAAAPPEADASMTTHPGVACVVQVADCMPVLFAAPGGVAAAHAGWRGLAGGVLERTVEALRAATGCAAGDIEAWFGPCIGPRRFEVGADVLQGFGVWPEQPGPRFVPHTAGKWLADLPGLGRDRLAALGITRLHGGEWCTVEDDSRFFSFRRDRVTGRMAAAIWLAA